MTDDLVKRLRDADAYNSKHYVRDPLHSEAAKRIEALEAKVQSLTALLDNQLGTPCEQVRHQEQVDALEAKMEKAEHIVRILASAELDDRLGEAVDLACEYLAEEQE